MIELVALGAGSILPRPGYGCSGYALLDDARPEVTLLDCGPGTLRGLGELGVGVERVRRVVVSHFHPDHVLDLFALAFARRSPALAPPPPLELVGPRGLAALAAEGAGRLARWTRHEQARVVEVDPAPEVRTLELAGARLSWVATGHAPEALAWRVALPGAAELAYSGDAPEAPQLAALARGVDVFLCECSFPEEHAVEGHLTPRGAGRLARAAGCRRLILTHFYPSMDPDRARSEAALEFAGPIEAARDRSRHPLLRAEP